MKIRPVEAKLLHADGQTQRQVDKQTNKQPNKQTNTNTHRYNDPKRRFPQFCERN
jgi:hypothetical protein